jgi:hypothetical protein
MAITTLDGVVAGMQPPVDIYKLGAATVAARLYSPWYVAGQPGLAVVCSSGVAGSALTSYGGQIPFTNPAGGEYSYLARFVGNCNVAGTLFLCDRLWHNNGIDVTSINSQNINSVEFPARDVNGTVNGENVLIGVEVSTIMGAGTPTYTMGYTNSAGDAGRSIIGPVIVTAMTVGSFVIMPLQAGDTGVKSIQTWQQSATQLTGLYSLVAFRILARIGLSVANIDLASDAITGGFPRLFDNTVPFLLWLPTTTTAPTILAQMTVSQG